MHPDLTDDTTEPAEKRVRYFAQIAAVIVIIVFSYMVLQLFIPAILFAAVVCCASWDLYLRLRTALRGRSTLAALVMTLLLTALVIAPSVLLTLSLAENVSAMVETAKAALAIGAFDPPAWISQIPTIGNMVVEYWQSIASGSKSLVEESQFFFEPLRDLIVSAGKLVGRGLLQLTLATFVGFFFYRDGEALAAALIKATDRLAGGLGQELLHTVYTTVNGVVRGVFGTALVQAIVALIGFLIAGIPSPFLLAATTFFLSIVPIGPPLVWGGATLWLFSEGQTGWAIFMGLWGLLAISTIDNIVKPYLISRNSSLPLLLIVLGVVGGVAAFGFIGLFIGPPVLAVALALTKRYLVHAPPKPGVSSEIV